MTNLTFSNLENDVIRKLLTGENPVINTLRKQSKNLLIKSREITGHGFFIDFIVPKNLQLDFPEVKQNFAFGDVEVSLPSLRNGVGFLLWVENGLLSFLEGYTYSETWTLDLTNATEYTLRYINPKNETYRNWELLEKAWTLSPKN